MTKKYYKVDIYHALFWTFEWHTRSLSNVQNKVQYVLLFGAFKKVFESHLKLFDLNKLGVFKFTTKLKKKLLSDKKKKPA